MFWRTWKPLLIAHKQSCLTFYYQPTNLGIEVYYCIPMQKLDEKVFLCRRRR